MKRLNKNILVVAPHADDEVLVVEEVLLNGKNKDIKFMFNYD